MFTHTGRSSALRLQRSHRSLFVDAVFSACSTSMLASFGSHALISSPQLSAATWACRGVGSSSFAELELLEMIMSITRQLHDDHCCVKPDTSHLPHPSSLPLKPHPRGPSNPKSSLFYHHPPAPPPLPPPPAKRTCVILSPHPANPPTHPLFTNRLFFWPFSTQSKHNYLN